MVLYNKTTSIRSYSDKIFSPFWDIRLHNKHNKDT